MPEVFSRIVVLLALMAFAPGNVGEAFADRAETASPAHTLAQSSDQPVLPPCTCRAAGRTFDMGETTCLETPSGPRLAVCAMDQNVSSWRATPNACPSARRGAGVL